MDLRICGSVTALAVWFIIGAGCVGRSGRAVDLPVADLISFHWPAEQPGPNVRMCEVAATGDTIALLPDPIIGVVHLDTAYLANPTDHHVTVRLTKAGLALIAEATTARIGQRLALVVDNRVVAMPVITRPIDNPVVPLMPQPTPADAAEFAVRVNEAIARSRSSVPGR